MKLRAYMTGVERGRVGQKGEKGEDLGIGGDDKGWRSLRRPIFYFSPFFFFGLPRRLSIRLLLSFVVSV